MNFVFNKKSLYKTFNILNHNNFHILSLLYLSSEFWKTDILRFKHYFLGTHIFKTK